MYRFNHPSASNTSPEQKNNQSRSVSLKKALAIGAVPLLLLFSAAFQSPNSVPGQLQAIQSQLHALMSQNSGLESQISALQAQVKPRKFYLTNTETHNGAHALSACAVGFHMASLWEIHDPTYLRYDTVLGATRADSGDGPPTGLFGWIRTGQGASFGHLSPGVGICNAWMSADGVTNGTIVSLKYDWTNAGTAINPWNTGVAFCDLSYYVWCVQD